MNKDSFFEKIKRKFKNTDLKVILRFATFILGLLFIIITAIVHVGWSPDIIDVNQLISRILIMICISVFGILMGESFGIDRQKSKADGLYQNTLRKYNNALSLIDSIKLYFADFLMWYRAKETYNKQVAYLLNNEVLEAKEIVEHMKLEQVEELKHHAIQLENGKCVRAKNEDQIQAITKVLEGKIFVKSPDSTYYLNAFTSVKTGSELEYGQHIDKAIKSNKTFQRTFKILTSLIFAIVWAGITVGEFMKKDDVGAWVDLVMRLLMLVTCLYSGWLTAVIDVNLQSQKLSNKTNIIEKFRVAYNSKEFIPTDYEDLARIEYEQYMEQNLKSENE